MTNWDILKFINFVVNKHQKDNMTFDQFNNLLDVCEKLHFKKKVGIPDDYLARPFQREAFEIVQKITDDLKSFKVTMGENFMPMIVDVAGRALYPSDYYYVTGIIYLHYKSAGDIQNRQVNICTDAEFNAAISSFIIKPTLKDPVCNFQSAFIRFRPITLQRVNFSYLRFPAVPYLDVCFGPNLEEYYMPAGSYIDAGSNLISASGVLIASGVSHTTATVFPYTSLTVESEWNDINKIDIAALIIDKFAINLREQDLKSYMELYKQQGT